MGKHQNAIEGNRRQLLSMDLRKYFRMLSLLGDGRQLLEIP